ncbi:TonB-dependent receptor [Teredinibacter franksiae]|uniref:TonB-dependent receptor n=1 Tax=Teredinibacter franksiae TaxID=2761453 RepID=UPI001626DCCE|nr:TonB-dependent receptor [Teredinibacter franksiae]
MFKKNKLSSAVVGVLAASAVVSPAFAQEPVEEVYVTGIRASLEASMDVKRQSAGVVDAISSEDIGKFPDTNLAESLQRITGVSINRVNGEGSEVTVRGFGADKNMVTLNGRTMPSGGAYGGGSGADGTTRSGGDRAFDFSNLAAENVSGVEVYKTSKANIATGGIGATINIKTARPLDNPGFRASVGAKAIMDTTNRYNSDVTPELSGLVSWTDDNEQFGAALSLSHQQRDSGYTGVTVNDWNIGVWGEDNLYNNDGDIYENQPVDGQLYARPNDFRYAFSDTQRERTNGQLTLQFAPTEHFTGTMDYTYAKNDVEEYRGEVTNWIQNGSNVAGVEFDNSAVATPISVTEAYNGTVDIGYEQQYRSQSNELNSLGVNLDFQLTDTLSFTFDVHNSQMDSDPTGPDNSGEVAIGLGSPTVSGKSLYFDGDIPTYTYETTVPDNAITPANIGSSIGRVRGAGSSNEITQIKLDGTLEFDQGRFDFGVETRAMEMAAYQTSGANQTLGNWGIANPGEFADDLFTKVNVHSEFEDANVSRSPTVAWRADAVELYEFAETFYPDSAYLRVEETFSANDIVNEDTTAAYFQVALSGDLGGMPVNFLTGVRYESTKVESVSAVTPVSYLVWENNNDFSPYTDPSADVVNLNVSTDYDHLLPSMDFDISFKDDLIGRFSYSKTIARAGYGQMRVSPSNFGTSGSTFNGTRPTADSFNPALLPLESDNLDLSLEWYFGETSYASAGLFEKRVANFIGTGQVDQTHYGILDQTNGQRVMDAAGDLSDLSLPSDDTNLYAMVVLNEHPEALDATNDDGDLIFPNGVFEATTEQLLLLGETDGWDVVPEEGDPEMVFRTSRPENNKEATIYGAEFAVQHFFGDTGFGVLANYTFVNGDVGFDNLAHPDDSQFALTGLSDTANLVLMYENYGVQARLAYNWRDEFLDEANFKGSNNPRYVEEYSQIDLNVSYDITDDLAVSFEGINITGEDYRQHARNSRQLWYYDDLGARWQAGVRYKF